MAAAPRLTDHGFVLDVPDATLQVDSLLPGLVRVRRYGADGPSPTPLLRYRFFRGDWPATRPAVTTAYDGVALDDGRITLRVDAAGRTEWFAAGQPFLTETKPATGFQARFSLPDDVAFFGLGDQTRERLEHRGTRCALWVRNVSGYVPVPFFWTTRGYGLLANTTRRAEFDLGHDDPQQFGFSAPGGTLDYYLLYGPEPAAIFELYTALTGRPPLPPKWAMGLFFISRTQANDKEFLDDCLNFRREDIPCDAISLEPGWMAQNYDYAVTKDWHPERFPVPPYARTGRHNFFPAARRLGFKPGLWLCNDYDLSYEEERQAATADAAAAGQELPTHAEIEQDAHLFHARRFDTLTRPEEPWFQHLKSFVDQGADYFKQDGANQVLDHPDRVWGNGMLDDEMHNLYPLLYARQMYQGFAAHTGRRPFGFTVAGWAGLQQWTATWTGDTGGEEGPLGACLNLSLTAHGLTTPDMEVTTAAGIHFGFFTPWAQLNSWNYWRHPWLLGEPLTSIFREYAKLRYRLIPYLYSVAWEAHRSGWPMMQARPLLDPANRATHGLLRQYLLGPALLVGAFTDEVWLPAGTWTNFWTEEPLEGPVTISPALPADRGGPLLVKAGSIVPMGPDLSYVGQRPDDEMTVHVWPGGTSEFTLYEDDGLTFAHERGAYRTTKLSQITAGGAVTIDVAAAEGTFDGAVAERRLTLVVHGGGEPTVVDCGVVAVGEAVRQEVGIGG